MKKKTNTGKKKTNDGLRRSKSTRWKYNGSSGKGSVGETSDDGNNDKVELLEKGFEDGLKEKEVDVQSFDRKYFRTELGLIPHEKIETYQHRIHPFDEKHMNDFLVEYRRMGNDVWEGKPKVTIQPDGGNLKDMLEFIDGRNVVRKGVSSIIVDGHHRLTVIREINKDTTRQLNWTRENIGIFITRWVDGTAFYSNDIMQKIKLLSSATSKASLNLIYRYFFVNLLHTTDRSTSDTL